MLHMHCREYAGNKRLRPVLLSCIDESGLAASSEKTRSELVVRVATKVPEPSTMHGQDVSSLLYSVPSLLGKASQPMSPVRLQYPDNALVHRKDFLRDYIAMGKIKVCAFTAPGVCSHGHGPDGAV